MIKVNVKLFAPLSRQVPGYDQEKGIDVIVEEGSSLGDLIRTLGLPEEEGRVMIVNGIPKKITDLLRNVDEVKILTPIGGG